MSDATTPLPTTPAKKADGGAPNGDGSSGSGGSGGSKPNLTGKPWWAAFWLALGIVLLFLVFSLVLVFLANNETVTEAVWSRYLFVFAALEAIAFTAVGWVFGREVHRGEAESAKKDADGAKKDASDAAAEAAKGQAIAAAILALDEPISTQGDGGSQIGALKAQARALYPSVGAPAAPDTPRRPARR